MKGLWLIISTLASFIDESFTEQNSNPTRTNSRRVVDKFATFQEIMDWYASLQRNNIGLVDLIDIGETYEGRRQVVMRVSARSTNDRPAVFIEAALHGREWLATSSLNYVIDKMIFGYQARNPRFVRAMNKYIFYFMSVTNPDGYVFTFNQTDPENRYWRKNRRPHHTGCVGVDLNRNWEVGFGGEGSSPDPCASNYHGNGPFSEPETANMRHFMEQTIRVGRLTLYIALHSFSQLWVVPYSYTRGVRPRNYWEMVRAATYASQAAKNKTGRTFRVGNGADIFGVTVGGSDDWVLINMRANYSYTLECRPTDDEVKGKWRNGFNRNASDILPSGQEVLASVMALVDTMNP